MKKQTLLFTGLLALLAACGQAPTPGSSAESPTSPGLAAQALTVIQDEPSCQAAGGYVSFAACIFSSPFIVREGEAVVWRDNGVLSYVHFNGGLINEGTLTVDPGLDVSAPALSVNTGLMNLGGSLYVGSDFSNAGTINVTAGGFFFLTNTVANLINEATGTVNVRGGGWLYNDGGAIINNNVIKLYCGSSSMLGNFMGHAPVGPDCTAPTVTVEQAQGQADPTSVSSITVTVTFSEPVTGFDGSDIALGGSAGARAVTVSGDGPVYTVRVSGMTQSGTVTASVPAGAAQDAEGNLSAASTGTDTTVSFNFVEPDTTAPTTSLTSPAQGATYTQGATVNAAYTCADEAGGSGLASCVGTVASGAAIDTASVGPRTFTVTATDKAGNVGTKTVGYTVAYPFRGFLQPVDNLPTVNTVKAGSSVPIKFSLVGNRGLNILAAGSPSVKVVPCDGSAPADEIEQTLATSTSSLSYDAASDTYSYVWKTDKSWAGSCRQLNVALTDGTSHLATFKFR